MLSKTYGLLSLRQFLGPNLAGKALFKPYKILRLCWTEDINHFDRTLVIVFLCANGMALHIVLDWESHMGILRDSAAVIHLKSLCLEFGTRKHAKLQAFNVGNHSNEHVDRTVRYYIHFRYTTRQIGTISYYIWMRWLCIYVVYVVAATKSGVEGVLLAMYIISDDKVVSMKTLYFQ